MNKDVVGVLASIERAIEIVEFDTITYTELGEKENYVKIGGTKDGVSDTIIMDLLPKL